MHGFELGLQSGTGSGAAIELERGYDQANSEVVKKLQIVLLIVNDLRYQYYNTFIIKINNKIRR